MMGIVESAGASCNAGRRFAFAVLTDGAIVARRMLLPLVAALIFFGAGCQPRVNKAFPVPLPLEPSPAQSVVVVGEGSTADEARRAAMERLVREVLLPGGPEELLPFIESMIRGYDVVSIERDLFGRYYVTVELTMAQLAQNYQELYGRAEQCMEQLAEESGGGGADCRMSQ